MQSRMPETPSVISRHGVQRLAVAAVVFVDGNLWEIGVAWRGEKSC